MKQSERDKQASEAFREEIEGRFTRWRIAELEASPVAGNFDVAHLKEVNRRIFQDLPGAGFDGVTPGEFRKPTSETAIWMKQRGLSTVPGSFYVAYSRMDGAATTRLDQVLEDAKPDKLRNLKPEEFIDQLSKIYTELDYAHPFSDGNSRTLRTFTKQLAEESGYELDWERFNSSEADRDRLYMARDRSANELAMPHLQREHAMRKILRTQETLKNHPNLPDLLRHAVRLSRVVTFQKTRQPQIPPNSDT